MSAIHTPAVRLLLGDCLERMAEIEPGSVDMVLTDLPYGTTQNKWDSVIPFDQLWPALERVAKPSAAIVLTAAQPFTSALVMSRPKLFRYQWVWEKPNATGFLNAKKQPLRAHEDVLVFCRAQPAYMPQMRTGCAPYAIKRCGGTSENYGQQTSSGSASDGERYPRTVLQIAADKDKLHPTQKPVALMEYLIRTYSNAGETVLDCTMGSGTTGVGCVNTGRSFIGIELDPAYFAIAQARVAAASAADLFRVPLDIGVSTAAPATASLFEPSP